MTLSFACLTPMLASLSKHTSKTRVLFFRNGKVLNYTSWCAICKCFGQDHSSLKPHCRGQWSRRYLFSDGCRCLTDLTLIVKTVDAYFPQDNLARACGESVNICLLSEIHACLLPVSKSAVLVSKNEESCKP